MSIAVPSSQFCIAIASHIREISRVSFLLETLTSLVNQSIKIPIYLSISFDNDAISTECLRMIKTNKEIEMNNNMLNIKVQKEITPQMRHYLLLLPELEIKHKWIMFCDDDDKYNINRVETIINTINAMEDIVNKDESIKSNLAGIYENVSKKPHTVQRHEYWCYCVQIKLLKEFMDSIKLIPEVVNDRCCDVLFAEYLRRKSSKWVYIGIHEVMYNYRVDNNTDSVTGRIQSSQQKYANMTSPPPVGDNEWLDYVLNWNEYLYQNIDIFLHDTYLRTIVGFKLDAILQLEFRDNYKIIDYVDQTHIKRITDLYNKVRLVCDSIYDNKLE